MSLTYANTSEIEEIAKELSSISNDYTVEINNLFTRLSNVPSETKEWQGEQSEKYHNIIAGDKAGLLNIGKELKYLADKLKSDALEISNSVNIAASNEGRKSYK